MECTRIRRIFSCVLLSKSHSKTQTLQTSLCFHHLLQLYIILVEVVVSGGGGNSDSIVHLYAFLELLKKGWNKGKAGGQAYTLDTSRAKSGENSLTASHGLFRSTNQQNYTHSLVSMLGYILVAFDTNFSSCRLFFKTNNSRVLCCGNGNVSTPVASFCFNCFM